MLFATSGQIEYALILLLFSSLLCVVVFFVNFFIKKVKNNILKLAFNHIFDLLCVFSFAFCYFALTNHYNYGLIRWYSILCFVLPIVVMVKLIKKHKLKQIWFK